MADDELLLVEDTPTDIELMLRALKSVNMTDKVHAVGDGKEALDYIFNIDDHGDDHLKNCPKVILLDLKLPKISGFDVLKRIKTHAHAKSIPVVIVTSSNQSVEINLCYTLGANSYIVKPFNLEDFMITISKAVIYWLRLNHSPTCKLRTVRDDPV